MTVMALPMCKCKRVVAILQKLGATHAARMHYLMSQGIEHKWTKEDWLLHFREEETILFPILLKLGMAAQVARLARDHARFRFELARFGKVVSADALAHHAAVEDDLVLQIPEPSAA